MQKSLADKNTPFSLIVLDLNMPISDGYDALKNIRLLFDEKKIFKIEQNFLASHSDSHHLEVPQQGSPKNIHT